MAVLFVPIYAIGAWRFIRWAERRGYVKTHNASEALPLGRSLLWDGWGAVLTVFWPLSLLGLWSWARWTHTRQ